jgi:hypothetical protein
VAQASPLLKEATMNRRAFLKSAFAGASVIGTTEVGRPVAAEQQRDTKKARMKAGHQHHSSDADLRVLAALGVGHICSALPSRTYDENWSADGLLRLRERVERFGIKLEMVPLPLSSVPIGRAANYLRIHYSGAALPSPLPMAAQRRGSLSASFGNLPTGSWLENHRTGLA